MKEVIFTLLPGEDSDPVWLSCNLCGEEIKEIDIDIHAVERHDAKIITVKYERT